MRTLLLTIIALALAGFIAYTFLNQQQQAGKKVQSAAASAQVKADAYKENQAKMMKELGQ